MFEDMSPEMIASLGLGMVAMEAKNLELISEEYDKRAKEGNTMKDDEKTAEQLRAELIADLKAKGGQLIDEIAMPGVVRPVNTDN